MFVRYTLPLLLWFFLMLILGSLPSDQLPDIDSDFQWDKVVHVIEYFGFGVLFWRWLRVKHRRSPVATAGFVFIVGCLLGLIDEVHQLWIPGRYATWQDWAADTFGILLAIGLCMTFHRSWKRNRLN